MVNTVDRYVIGGGGGRDEEIAGIEREGNVEGGKRGGDRHRYTVCGLWRGG